MNRSPNVVAGPLPTMTADCGGTTEPARAPSSSQAVEQAGLIAAAERALRACVAAYSAADPEAMMRVFTRDAIVECALGESGTYVLVEVTKLIGADVGSSMPRRSVARISNLWITPTTHRNSVFVHYTLDALLSANFRESEHLALIEMRGDRIARIRDFNADAAIASTVEKSVTGSADLSNVSDQGNRDDA